MVKKILMALGVLLVAIVSVFVGLLIWSQRTGAALQDKFFAAVESGEPDKLIALLHPNLRTEVDAPVLAVWMKMVRDNLGAFKGLSKSDFNTSAHYGSGGTRIESRGTVDFEKGAAQVDLAFVDDQLVKMDVQSKQFPADWFKGPASTELYRTRGQEFLQHFLSGEIDAAYAMLHPEVQKQLPPEKLKTLLASITEKLGKLKTLEYKSESSDATHGYHVLTELYHVTYEHGESTSAVNFQFVDLCGRISLYKLNSSDK